MPLRNAFFGLVNKPRQWAKRDIGLSVPLSAREEHLRTLDRYTKKLLDDFVRSK